MTTHDEALSDDDLDQLLSLAHTDLLTYVSTTAAPVSVPASLPAKAPISSDHLRLREIARRLVDTEVLAESLTATFAADRAYEFRQAVDRALDDARSEDLRRVPDLLRALNVALARVLAVALVGAPAFDHHLGELIVTVARAVADAGDLAGDLARKAIDAGTPCRLEA
ncbi:hypothetical protein [Nonomuraea jabiensis]|uniref:Uncharacterized protein n=1 Tax=Nonomuraea jabiensis TaxID=882448 RepID=A0A7W9G4D6_9ACTN|nr:hypothetical protein [Nonomuraea jabiensis]MBB5776932.1 hypothetical protein [Nonomuraea jabiensis]